ncbi:hypothetical protein Tco_1030418 [Tanacetum coccineum]|uniref:Uncharacterized protein n=1 Tax=Tanacetum coccineum TaxID=301880 RepID=A0ABQ5G661_9ASTR
MALFPRLEEIAIAVKSTMMADQVLVFMEREVYKDLKFEEKFREFCLEIADTVKDMTKVIGELERFPRLRENLEAVETTRVLKRVQ